ncbi:MAG: hypothetical protein M0Q91_18210 [Methanoregula sp.]|jgi:rRNA maturation protein Nop10|nr:hypothetical protein [Methanoregula sp.]
MITKCDCGNPLTEKDVVVMDQAGADYYPYEGEVYTFVCPVCGGITTVPGNEVKV